MINKLVLSGGGINGIIFLGIIKYLEVSKQLKNINTFVGSSIGSIINTLVCIGYTYDELKDFILDFDLKTNNKNLSFKNNNNSLAEPNDLTYDNNMEIKSKENFNEVKEELSINDKNNETKSSNLTIDKCDCKKLLREILKCKECQELIYKHLNQEYQKKSFTITNNDILNSVFIGFFIILVLDIFVKIGKLYSTKY